MDKNKISKTGKDNVSAPSKRKSGHLGGGFWVLFILGTTVFIGPFIALFFSLYLASPDFQLFLILAVLGIILYVWIISYMVLKSVCQETGPIIRIKGREYRFWGLLIVASIGVLLTYYLLGGLTILFDHFVKSDLSWRLFDTVCSSKVFWWITSICLFVFAASWASKEGEIREALSKKRHSVDGNLGVTMFPEVGQIMPLKSIQIFQVFSDGSALAFTSDKAPAEPVVDYKGPTAYLFADAKIPYYDDLVITVPEEKVVRQVGTYRFNNKYGVKTVPIISILDKHSDDC